MVCSKVKIFYLLGSLLLLLSWPTLALSSADQTLFRHFNFAEFSIAFILGLTLPFLLFVAFLKPILAISWRYPALLTLTLVMQFYAFSYLSFWQIPVLLSSAVLFVALICLWLVEQRSSKIAPKAISAFVLVLLSLFIAGVFTLRTFDIYQMWLAFLAVMSMIAVTIQFRSKESKQHLRVFSLWLVIACYGVALYQWLNANLEGVWIISLAVFTYTLAMLNGCWHIVNHLFIKFEQLKPQLQGDIARAEKVDVLLDPITNLPNYQQALSQLKPIVNHEIKRSFAAIVFKPLNFEQVNKVLGHQNSDILLLQLAYNLQKNVSENPLLVNFSHDEQKIKISRLQGLDFLVVVNGELSHHPIKIVVEDICQHLKNSVPKAMSFKSFSLNFELAFGVSISSKTPQSIEQLIAQASDALLDAESNHQFLSYFDPTSVLYTEQQLAKMEKLKKDIIEEQLVWLAHPQISLVDNSIKGFELTIDWQSYDGKRLSSIEFSKVAEYSGEIYRLTKQMIKQAFELLTIMQRCSIDGKVSINLSSKDLLEPELADYIESQSKKAKIPLDKLVIELSEEVLLSSAFRARMMIDQFKAMEINIAIDNFSGSYESLRYLRRTSVQQVKIECTQLHNDGSAKSEKTIVNALINLIRKMDIPLIATGVNNREISKAYEAMGGEVIQGNLIHQGVEMSKISAWLSDWQATLKKA